MWEVEKAAGFENQYKKFVKKHEGEASAAMSNLETYLAVLQETNNAQAASQQPFVHSEPEGMVAIDQRGGQRQLHLPINDNYTYRLISRQSALIPKGGNECGLRINR